MSTDVIATLATVIVATVSVGALLLRLEGRVAGLDTRVSGLENRMNSFENRMSEFGERLARIEGLLEGHFSRGSASDTQE